MTVSMLQSAAQWLDMFGPQGSEDFAPCGLGAMSKETAHLMIKAAKGFGWPGEI